MSSVDRGSVPQVASAAVVGEPDRSRARHIAARTPYFAYFLLVYIAIELTVGNVRDVLFTFGGYSLTWVEVMYLLASFMAMGELLRVSKPGIDNTYEALAMLGIWIVYLVLFVLGSTGISWLSIFSNTEFLMIGLLSAAQVILAFMINARTLKRTIDYTTDGDSHSH